MSADAVQSAKRATKAKGKDAVKPPTGGASFGGGHVSMGGVPLAVPKIIEKSTVASGLPNPETVTLHFPEGVSAKPTATAIAVGAAYLSAAQAEYVRHVAETYYSDPVGFLKDVILANCPDIEPDEWQVELMVAIATGKRRISVRAGHGVGKTAVLAWVVIWFICTRYPQKTVLTAPTASQLFDALFSEIKHWLGKLPVVFADAFEVLSDQIRLKSDPSGSFVVARTSSSDKPEALQGYHSDNILLVVDEASGVPEAVFEAAVGSMSGHNAITVLLGNPTRNSGLFFKTHHELKGDWFTIKVSCLDCKRVSRDFIEQVKSTYGENSNAYRVRILGEFSLRDDDVLIPAELVDAAMSRDIRLSPTDQIVYGVDVARFGNDRSVLVKRQGGVVLEIKKWSAADLMETVGRVVHEAQGDKPAEICVDSIGMGGGVADRLRELGFNVRDVNVSESSAMNPQAARLRDELWLNVKDWLAQRACKLPNDSDLRQELCSPTYTFLSNGKIKVEGKPEMKKRGLRSPDIADALCLTFAGTAALIGGRALSWIPGKALKRNLKGTV